MLSKHLLPSTLYLACVSALATVILYMLGAYEVAVIELSVGAGLVTVLLVYVLSVVGDDLFDPPSNVPKPLAFLLVVPSRSWLDGWHIHWQSTSANGEVLLAMCYGNIVHLDVWVQVALIFSGVMGMLGLLSEKNSTDLKSKYTSIISLGEERTALPFKWNRRFPYDPYTFKCCAVWGGVIAGVGFYGLLITRNLIKIVLVLQILVKAVIIALVLAGKASGNLGLGQSLAANRHRSRYHRSRGRVGAGDTGSQTCGNARPGKALFFTRLTWQRY